MSLLRPIAWRPALVLLIGLVAGMLVGAGVIWPLLGAGLALAYEGWRARGVGLAAVLLGLLLHPAAPPRVLEVTPGMFTVRVATLPRAVNAGTSFLAELPGGVRLAAFAAGRGLAMGDIVRVEGRLVPLQRGPDDYLISRRVAGRLRIRRLERLARGSRWASWLTAVSDGVEARLERRLGPERGRLVGAICFNLDGLLEDGTTDVLRRSGAYHLVSASGMHAQVIAGLVLLLGRFLPVPRAAWIGFGAGLLILYSAMTGWHVATLRSALMWSVAALAYTVRRAPDGLSALGLFGAIWLACDPADLYDVGFALTMVVTVAIVAAPRIEGGRGVREGVAGLFAWAASEPLLILMTGRWLPLALPANLSLGIVSGFVLGTGLGAGLIPGPIGDLFAVAAGGFVQALMWLAGVFARPSAGQIWISTLSPALVVGFYIALAGGWLALERRRCPVPAP